MWRAPLFAPAQRAESARSTRPRHSSISDRCIHNGTAAAVKFCGDRCLTIRREGPVELRAEVVDLRPVFGQSFGRWPRLPFGFGPLKEITAIFGVAAVATGTMGPGDASARPCCPPVGLRLAPCSPQKISLLRVCGRIRKWLIKNILVTVSRPILNAESIFHPEFGLQTGGRKRTPATSSVRIAGA